MGGLKRRTWFERSFEVGLNPSALPDIIERLRGTPQRLEERVRGVSSELLVRRVDGAWSIQEHAGHLGDLEPLWLGRLADLAAGEPVLRPADLTNRGTWEAAHNDRSLDSVLETFRTLRTGFVESVESLGPDDLTVTADHPRLGQPMAATDLCFFVAEHDDHHLAWITALRAAG